jgi:hypothetical protein
MSGPGGKDARNDNDSAGLSANITTFVPKRPNQCMVLDGNGGALQHSTLYFLYNYPFGELKNIIV